MPKNEVFTGPWNILDWNVQNETRFRISHFSPLIRKWQNQINVFHWKYIKKGVTMKERITYFKCNPSINVVVRFRKCGNNTLYRIPSCSYPNFRCVHRFYYEVSQSQNNIRHIERMLNFISLTFILMTAIYNTKRKDLCSSKPP